MSHVSSAEFCDSNVDLRGVSQRELPTVKSFSWEFFDGAKRGCKYKNSVSTFDFVGLLTLQMPAHSRSSATSLIYLLLKSVSAEIICVCLENLFPSRLSSKKGC